MLEVHAILQRQRCNENITKKTGTLSDAYKYLSILIAADILNVEEEDIIEEARRDNKLYSDEDKNLFVPVRWIGDWYNDALATLGISSVIYIQTRGTGKVKILIERDLE